MSDVTIVNGSVVTPRGVVVGDVVIADGVIAEVSEGPSSHRSCQILDASGAIVLPGIIDAHVHMALRSRGTVTADDFRTGTLSAAMGGVTVVIDYADHEDGLTLTECAARRVAEAGPEVGVDFSIHQVVKRVHHGTADELRSLLDLGVSSVKIFTTYKEAGYMLGNDEIQTLLGLSAETGVLVTVHAEDNGEIERAVSGLLESASVSRSYHPRARPAKAEAVAVAEVCRAAGKADAPVYFVHISSLLGMQEIMAARANGVRVYAETCPHYLLLDEGAYALDRPELVIMSPPLRSKEDITGLWEAVRQGHIDVVATDHCAFTQDQKAHGTTCFDTLPGVPGVETLLPLMYTYGVLGGILDLMDMVRIMSYNPARIFGLSHRKGAIEPGRDGDIVIYSPDAEQILSARDLHSRAGYSPFEGIKVNGRVVHVFLRGKRIVTDGVYTGRPGDGEFIPAQV